MSTDRKPAESSRQSGSRDPDPQQRQFTRRLPRREFTPIADYGLIGDLRTCALVSREGSVDWLCLPRLDSPSVFGALLDPQRGGRWSVRPCGSFSSIQVYEEDTNVLRTTFVTATGTAELTDVMPLADEPDRSTGALLRELSVTDGTVQMRVEFEPRFDYARGATTLESVDGGVRAAGSGQALYLTTPLGLTVHEDRATAEFTVSAGDRVWFALCSDGPGTWSEQRFREAIEQTRRFWRGWARRAPDTACLRDNPWRDVVLRSALVLKLLSCDPRGGIAAAATTSLPEDPGGVRNWDYRYAWVRDASFTVQALYNLGYHEEARSNLRWFREICEDLGDLSDLRVMYAIGGRPAPEERVLDHLRGYLDSRPVRVGNAAVHQSQLDVYGELVDAFYQTTRYDHELSAEDWSWVRRLADHVCAVWQEPDRGIWEVRGEPRHFTHSKLMCWVALDRALRLAEEHGHDGPLHRWRTARREVRGVIERDGFSEKRGSFVQYLGGDVLDATGLLIPLLEFLPPEDERVQGTIEAVMRHLMQDGLVQRYEHTGQDGLPGGEGAFLLCSFWLVSALAVSGRTEEAEGLLAWLLRHASPAGLMAEEVDADTGTLLGNYPQAFSHVGLINSVLYLCGARRGEPAPEPTGSADSTRRHRDREAREDGEQGAR